MRLRALALRLAVPLALVALVGVLGALQYRWLGQVSAAELQMVVSMQEALLQVSEMLLSTSAASLEREPGLVVRIGAKPT